MKSLKESLINKSNIHKVKKGFNYILQQYDIIKLKGDKDYERSTANNWYMVVTDKHWLEKLVGGSKSEYPIFMYYHNTKIHFVSSKSYDDELKHSDSFMKLDDSRCWDVEEVYRPYGKQMESIITIQNVITDLTQENIEKFIRLYYRRIWKR